MPTISVNKEDFTQLIGKPATLEQIDHWLEYVKGELKKYDEKTDEMRIELNDTNRPDLWCSEGIARQFRLKFGTVQYNALFDAKKIEPDKKIIVHENISNIRPFIGAFIATGIAVTEQFLIQMIQTQEILCTGYGKKRKTIAIGIYNADKFTFPVHYKAAKAESIQFIPLGSDRKMNLFEILTHHPKGIEFGPALTDTSLYPILLDNNSDILSFPPIINSQKSGEVVVGDKALFIEVTGIDLRMVLHTLNMLAYNLKDRGFKIEPVGTFYPYDTDYGKEVYSPYSLKNEIVMDTSLFERYLGSTFSTDDIKKYLNEYGVNVKKESNNHLKVSTHSYRQDYMHAVDVVEDLAISIGYDNFEPIMPDEFTIGKLKPMTILEDKVRETMIGMGFEEIISNILTNKDDFQEKMNHLYENLLEIVNVMNESYSILRHSLLPSLFRLETQSFQAIYPHRIFEVGEIIVQDKTDNHHCRTTTRLGALISHAEANFSEIGSYLESLQYLMFWDARIQTKNYPIFITGRSGEIIVDNEILPNNPSIGMIGEVHPEILDKWGIRMPTVAFEIDISMLASIYHQV